MSKLTNLIKNLCPLGIKFLTLGEVAEMKRGTSITKSNSLVGEYPVISGGREPAFYCNKYNREGEIITVAGSGSGAGFIQYWNQKIFVNDAFSIKGTEKILTKYIYYCLTNLQKEIYATKKGGGIPHVHISNIENFKIPVPPIEVQKEIIRILDTFTELIEKLSEEISLRKKQYEFYRDKLLTFGAEVEFKKLCEIAEIGTGNGNTESEIEDGIYPFFVRSPIVRRKNNFDFDETAIITSGDGVGVGKIFHYIEGKYALHQRAYRIHITDEKILPKFIFYYMSAAFYDYLQKVVFNSSVTSVRKQMIEKFSVPIPPIEEQARIVKILDRFDKLCNDLSEGLPAEISLRKKQYEFYRDKLLTFEELKY